MKNKDLITLIKKKEFKTFWHCLDYLILAGYSFMDAFGASLQEFSEASIYSSVAFVRLESVTGDVFFTGQNTELIPKRNEIIVGIVDESNYHLKGLYRTYREWYIGGKFFYPQTEIESTCEVIKIKYLNSFIIDYLLKVSKDYFGFEIFKLPASETGPNIRPITDDGNIYRDFDAKKIIDELMKKEIAIKKQQEKDDQDKWTNKK